MVLEFTARDIADVGQCAGLRRGRAGGVAAAENISAEQFRDLKAIQDQLERAY